jgi:sugar phosphate isomerase/epimerase
VRHPAARLAFDAFSLGREPGIVRRVPEIVARTAVVKLADRIDPLRSERDHRVPGEGDLPLLELVTAFQRAGYAGHFEVELWSAAVWSAADYATVLRSVRSAFAPVAPTATQPMPSA